MGVPVPEYPEYLIETNGQIFSLKTKKWMKQRMNANGYMSIELSNIKGHRRLLVHRLVALAYIPNPLNLPMINHKDENKANNNMDNLEWCDAKYNMNYGTGKARRRAHIDYSKPIYRINAVINGKKTSKKISQFSPVGEHIATYDSIKDAVRINGFKSDHITECLKGKRKTSNGFVWCEIKEG